MEPVLTTYVKEPNSYTLDFYLQHGGYEGMRKALGMKPDEIIELDEEVGAARARRRGLSDRHEVEFVPKDSPKPQYLCINADESEPGTFKDHVLMERNPHLLIEGCVIACHAIGAKVAYIYIRGEFYHVQQQLEAEIAKARAAGYLGKNIFGSGQRLRNLRAPRRRRLRSGRGDARCIESLEGKRAQPRLQVRRSRRSSASTAARRSVNNVETHLQRAR